MTLKRRLVTLKRRQGDVEAQAGDAWPLSNGVRAHPITLSSEPREIAELRREDSIMLFGLVAMCLGGAVAAIAMQVYRGRRHTADAAAWILVGNVNTLLRLDLDHLAGDDDNAGLRELRTALEATAAGRAPAERKLLERFNGLVGVAIAFGEKVHDAHGNVDLLAVANRRAHVQTALAAGEAIEAALGGLAELARDGAAARSDRRAPKPGMVTATAA